MSQDTTTAPRPRLTGAAGLRETIRQFTHCLIWNVPE